MMANLDRDGPWILYQYGDDSQKHRYLDQESKLAFTLQEFQQNEDPNRVIRLVRDGEWSARYPSVMGPDRSYFFMGPENNLGYIVFGNGNIHIPMGYMLRGGKKEGSVSRYWRGQNGNQYKWKATNYRMECLDNGRTLALWEVSPPDKNYYATLTIFPKAMPIITEVLTSLILNQMALALTWHIPSHPGQ
ncbi:hypothetical protein CPB83DRAFT_855232 [Crepidotus variabilis]|uniref:Uncharacterized protein n=1 Tax=Crepidotus variabilis TaxID=179855 RepID=A0A9P6EFG8_9AGAR|nr:hypothetical protein CPB83DRAFT_855232 [Crepidotus variabilis]